jgi:hypothetical protein
MAKRIEKDFAIRAVAEVGANFLANVAGQLVVQIGRQPFQDLDTISFSVTLVKGGLACAWICAYSVGHGVLLTIPNYSGPV